MGCQSICGESADVDELRQSNVFRLKVEPCLSGLRRPMREQEGEAEMICPGCGVVVGEDVQFCTKCGSPIQAMQPSAPPPGYAAYPPAVGVSRVQRHLQVLGILWCAYGILRLVRGALAIFFIGKFVTHGFFDWPGWGGSAQFSGGWIHALIPFIGIAALISAALSLLVGYALLTRRPWGRVLGIVIGILALINIPFGTALGIYTLWVLASGPSGMEYEAIADRS